MIQDNFNERIDKNKIEIEKHKKVCDRIGYLRLLAMIGVIYFIYKYIKLSSNTNFIYGFIGSLIIFIGLVIYHGKIKEKIKFCADMIEINERYLKRISGKWTEFEDMGEEFIDKAHPYSFDLDIVGKQSLFQLINVTNTYVGRRGLAQTLLKPLKDAKEILKRQKAIDELSNKIGFCQKVEYLGESNKEKLINPDKLLRYVENDESFIKNNLFKNIIYILPIITIPLNVIVIVFSLSSIKLIAYLLIVIQLIVWGIKATKLTSVLEDVGHFNSSLEEYLEILDAIEKEEFKSEMICNIKEKLFSQNSSSKVGIKKLYNISEKVKMRNNGILYIAYNVLFLWDYQCVFSLEKWKKEYGDKVRQWINSIGTIEELMSISVLSHLSEETILPTFKNEMGVVQAKRLGHPLIDSSVRVNNDVEMKENIFIITGSNMSGKTTYLRTIGINLVIAYAGGRVCADNMDSSIMDIYTSMRISDDLQNGISTFYGELIRIKDIINKAKESKGMIFLIDEIFRGTNSRDRITGAEVVIKHLNRDKAIGALTTHDLELCDLSDEKRIENYHFEEHYEEDKILFDYKIRKGKSTTTNAKYLMKIVGIDIRD